MCALQHVVSSLLPVAMRDTEWSEMSIAMTTEMFFPAVGNIRLVRNQMCWSNTFIHILIAKSCETLDGSNSPMLNWERRYRRGALRHRAENPPNPRPLGLRVCPPPRYHHTTVLRTGRSCPSGGNPLTQDRSRTTSLGEPCLRGEVGYFSTASPPAPQVLRI